MDLRHLRYFLAVADEMHFGRAAMRLGISQPPLSQQIRALEDELGVRLFERTSRRVKLTGAGEIFLPQARQTLIQAEHAILTARRVQTGEVGRLVLGMTASVPFVPKVSGTLYSFRETHPDVELKLQEMDRDAQLVAVEKGQIDIAIIRGFDRPPLSSDLVATMLVEERMVLAVRDNHPLAARKRGPSIADLRGEPLVLYGASSGAGFNEHLFSRCSEAGFRPMIVHEASGLATLLGLVAAGFGSTILAESLIRLQVANLVYRALADPVITRLWLIHKTALSPCAHSFMTIMEDQPRG